MEKDKNVIIRAIDETKSFVVFFGNTRKMINELTQKHHTSPVASAALGRTATMGSIMGLQLKGSEEKNTVIIKGDGPAKEILVVSNAKGDVKGYIHEPNIELPLNPFGKLDVSGAVGKSGKITVIKDLNMKEPYVGQTDLISGELAEDFTLYFAESEQKPSSVALSVLVDIDGSIKAAGGILIQLLPQTPDDIIDQIETFLKKLPPLNEIFSEDQTTEQVFERLFEPFNMKVLETYHPNWYCDCSRERMEKALLSVGAETLTEIIEEDGKAELVCQFCLEHYGFTKSELEQLLKEGIQ